MVKQTHFTVNQNSIWWHLNMQHTQNEMPIHTMSRIWQMIQHYAYCWIHLLHTQCKEAVGYKTKIADLGCLTNALKDSVICFTTAEPQLLLFSQVVQINTQAANEIEADSISRQGTRLHPYSKSSELWLRWDNEQMHWKQKMKKDIKYSILTSDKQLQKCWIFGIGQHLNIDYSPMNHKICHWFSQGKGQEGPPPPPFGPGLVTRFV